jgi:vacuolar protein sorting-associated protein 13A/C
MPTEENDMALVKADIKLDGSIFVTFSEAEEWPFEVENQSDHSVTMYQWVSALRTEITSNTNYY